VYITTTLEEEESRQQQDGSLLTGSSTEFVEGGQEREDVAVGDARVQRVLAHGQPVFVVVVVVSMPSDLTKKVNTDRPTTANKQNKKNRKKTKQNKKKKLATYLAL
jgi:hypothetical protein